MSHSSMSRQSASPRYEDLPDMLTVEDLQAFLRVSRNGAYELLKAGAIHHVRFGKLIRIPKSSLLSGGK